MNKTASTEEYMALREKLIPVAMEIHKQGSERFWNMALYWYVGDAIKSRGSLVDADIIPYDDVSHKEITRGQTRAERLKWRRVRNLFYLAKLMSKKNNKVVKSLAIYNLCLLFLRYFSYKLINLFKSWKKRNQLLEIANRYSDKNLSSAIYHLPKCYIEDFLFYYKITVNVSGVVDTRSLKNGFSVSYASNIDKGKQTALGQHGAFYGELTNHKGTDIEATLPDYFYTWGWSYADNQVPGEPQRLMSFKDRYSQVSSGTNRILLVMPSHVYSRDLDFLKNLYEGLNFLLKDNPDYKIVIRPRPSKVETNNTHTLNMIKNCLGADVNIDDIHDAAHSVKKSTLVVCLTHPANIFMECLYVNHPVITFSHDSTEYHPRYIEYVENIKEIGLVYDDIPSFTSFFDKNINDINGWWYGLQNEVKLKQYLKTYCGRFDC